MINFGGGVQILRGEIFRSQKKASSIEKIEIIVHLNDGKSIPWGVSFEGNWKRYEIGHIMKGGQFSREGLTEGSILLKVNDLEMCRKNFDSIVEILEKEKQCRIILMVIFSWF